MVQCMYAMSDEAAISCKGPASNRYPRPPTQPGLGSNGNRWRPCGLDSAVTASEMQSKMIGGGGGLLASLRLPAGRLAH